MSPLVFCQLIRSENVQKFIDYFLKTLSFQKRSNKSAFPSGIITDPMPLTLGLIHTCCPANMIWGSVRRTFWNMETLNYPVKENTVKYKNVPLYKSNINHDAQWCISMSIMITHNDLLYLPTFTHFYSLHKWEIHSIFYLNKLMGILADQIGKMCPWAVV